MSLTTAQSLGSSSRLISDAVMIVQGGDCSSVTRADVLRTTGGEIVADKSHSSRTRQPLTFGLFGGDPLPPKPRLAETPQPETCGGLPLPDLPLAHMPASTFYAVSTVDRWGRLADRSAVLMLDWRPGTRIAIGVGKDVVVAAVNGAGPHRIAARGHLRLPASVRHSAHIQAGDRLLLAAHRDRGLMIVYPPAVLDAMILTFGPVGLAGVGR